MKKIKSKIFKILLVTTFVLPTIFTQNACSKKKDVEKYENEINKLKEEIKILEKFKSDLSHEFEPFKNLMHKYGVNNYNDLMKELTCLNDPNLQEQVLSLADCLLRTKTITFLKLQEKINDEQGGNENVEILKTLVIPFNLKSINDLKSHFTINKEIITFAEKISKATDSDFIKHLEHEIDKFKIDIEHNNQELIPFYLEHLGDDNYTNWEGFIKQFDDLEGKEKNRAIIEKLAFVLNCSFDEVNKQKIEQLDKDIKNNAKELLVKKKEKGDEGKNKLEQFEQDRKELIPFYLSQLWDESYTGGENFIKQFDDLEGKEKNKTIIERLAEVLGCNFDEVTKEKISQLEGEVRDVLEIIKNQGQLIDKLKELEKCKKEAILFYFDQLWDESYTDWDSFITQFDNLEGKEENKAIIENLAFALDCSFDEVNKQKIEQLDKDIKDKVQGLLNKRKEAGDNGKDKLNEKETKFEQAKKQAIPFYLSQLWDESYTDWDSFTQFDNLEGKEKNKAIIENLAFALNCSFDEINKQKIEQLDKDIKDKAQELLNKRKEAGDNGKDKVKERSLKWYEINQYKDGPIAICLGQLGGKNYIGWDNFIKQFDNVEGKEKNKEIIDILSNLLDCSNELIDSKRINNLDQRVKIIAQEILIEKCEVAKEQIEQKEKRFVSCKNNLIGFCFEQLGDENYTSGENFIKQFDDSEGKEKNKKIIEKLAKILGCDYSAINHQKIADLDQITVDMVKKLFDEKRANKLKKKGEKNEKQFEQSKKELIAIYLAQLGDGRDYSDYSFFDYINMFITKFDDQEGKRKNELIITKLASVLNCSNEEINSKKIDDLGDGEICTIMRNKLKELADEKKKTWNEGKEKKENEFALKEKQLKQNREEIISFYIAKLGGSIYVSGGTLPDMINHDNWMEFVTQFDDPEGKEKNKEIIRILTFALDCSFDEVNKRRIMKLSDEIKNNAKKILDEMKEIEHKLQNEFKFDKNELIAFYLYQLGKENYIGWDNFIKQFDDFNWKNKNKAIIENLAFALNCSFDEVNKQKIKQLGKDIKDKAQELLNKRIAMENENEFALKEKQLEQNKKKIISFYVAMLGEGSYSTSFCGLFGIGGGKNNGSEFVTQFDDPEGKEKNRAIIEKLAFALNCSFNEVNKQKIEQLDKDIKDEVQGLLNKGKEAGDNGKNKLNEKETKFEQAKKEAIPFYLNQLWDESYKDWDNFITQFDNLEGKEKNKAIIENLAFALNCSFDEVNKQKIKQLGKDIKDKAQELLNKRIAMENENEFALKEKQLEQSRKEIISFYIAMLGDDIYNIQYYFAGDLYFHDDNGPEFVKQFDNLEGKGKNKAIIEKLASALNCSFYKINKQKIEQLDKNIKDKAQELLNKRKEAGDNGKDKLNEKETKFEQAKKEAIPFYLNQLGDESYEDWDNFIAQFDNLKGKEKNRAIIEKLASALNCSFYKINKQKIEQLDKNIKDKAQELLNKRKEAGDNGKDKLNEKETKFEQAKKEAIPFYLNQLGDESYIGWDNFIAQFDNLKGKEKNRAIIEKLAFALNCSFDEINKQKIGQLDKDKVKKMLDEKKKIFDVGKDKLNEKETKFEQAKKEAIPFYLNQLGDESYIGWDNFITQFDNLKGKEKNRAIIEKLAFALNCSFDEINKQKIEQLDKNIKDKAQELLNKRKEVKSKEFEQHKKNSIPYYIVYLADENYTNWDEFIKQFDDHKGKEKNKEIIQMLALAFGCDFNEINKQKIEQLDKDIKDEVKKLLDKKKKIFDVGRNKLKQFDQNKKEIIPFYLNQLGDENYAGWDNFITQFDNLKGKEKNRAIIENLAFALNCSFDEVNKQKIEQLDKNVKDKAQELLYENREVGYSGKKKKIKQLEKAKEELIVRNLVGLGNENYTDWKKISKKEKDAGFSKNGSKSYVNNNGKNFISMFDDSNWKEKNKEIIKNLSFLLNCSSEEINNKKIADLNLGYEKNGYDPSLKIQLANELRELYIKEYANENEFALKEKQLEQSRKEIISFYIAMLGDDIYNIQYYFAGDLYLHYDNGPEFVKQFDNLEGKEKNKTIIEKLAFALNCSFDEVNKQKIGQLDKDIKDEVKKMLDEKEKIFDVGKDKLNEKETKFEQAKKEAISFYLSQLWDGKYTNGENFIKQFDDLEGKGKNKAIIEKLASTLNCSFDEINKQKIEQLDKDIKDEVKKLLDKKKKNGNVGKEKRNEEFAQYKKEIIPFYIELLGDENYVGWDNFITQFDDLEGKGKNKAIIENLAFALNCSFDEVNKQKIEQLDNSVKYETQKLLDEKKIIGNWRKQTLGLKEEQFENDKKELTIFCLDQLGGENYTSWDNFIEQFDDSKGKEVNKTIIKELAGIWGYDFDEITKQVINQIDQNMKNETRKILDNKKNMKEELLRQKARQFEQSKEELIVFYLNQLSGKIYVCWDEFINQFDDLEGKLKEENLVIITKLASVLNCSNEEINGKKIDGLNKKIKNKAKILLNTKYEILNKIEEEKNLIKQFEYDRDQLIVICFKQLGRKNQIKGKDFLEQFDDSNWKEKNKTIIENLAFALNCSFDEINKQKIDNLIKTHKSLNLDKLSLDNNEKILSEEEKEKFEQGKKELIAIYLVQLWNENYSLGSMFITKFDDQEGKRKNELIITKLASVLNCSNEEINSKKIDDLDEEIKNEFESLIKTNDLNNLLRMNSIKNENLKQNFNKMNDLLKRINVMYKLCYISLEIYTSLADEKIEQKTTITEILEKFNKLHETNKTKVDQTLIKQEKMMRLLYNLMQKLNTQNVGTLIEKINNGLELLKFIIYDNESKKFDELINIFEDDEESGSENVEKNTFNELVINNDGYFDPS